ncbi:MAG: DNA polymerase III subunit alpha, partial [Acidimicrobiales bacterium]
REMPDIDMDFDERYRSEMIRYAAERYGWDRVAQVVTFSTIKARAAVRDAARVLGFSYSVGDRIAKAMPPLVMGRDTPLWACLEESPEHGDGYKAATELRQMYEGDPEARRVIDVARGLEGLRRQDSIHAAAVVVTHDSLTSHLPIQRKPEPGADPQSAPIVTQYEMHGVSDLGLLKMDFLGLRNLSVIERALDAIEATTGERPDIDAVDLEDEKTFAMLRRGASIGVFQLEGGPMRTLLRSLAPKTFDDVAALIALYRPGPMAANMHNDYADRKNGRKPITHLHPDMEDLLKDTYGLMIYQESMMRVAQRFAGYSLEEADNLRKACGKKIRALMAEEREKFVAACVKTGYGAEMASAIFDLIEPFADYAFPKSHAYGYGLVAYQTAWLKANHPLEYMSALLTSVKDDKDKTAVYLADCRNLGIEVVVPDINLSKAEFSPAGAGGSPRILFGLAAVRNVGEGLVERVVTEREANGAFADIYDFCQRVDPVVLNRRTMESLVKAGGFDSLGHPRRGLCLVFDGIVERTLERRRERDAGIATLFSAIETTEPHGGGDWEGTRAEIPDVEFDKAERIVFEKEMLGLYVSDHPLAGLESQLRRHTDCSIAEIADAAAEPGPGRIEDGAVRTLGGVVTELKRQYTKKGDLMCRFVLEDLEAAIEVFVFPKVMADFGMLLDNDSIVVLRARLDLREEVPKLVCIQVQRPQLASGPELRVSLPLNRLSQEKVDALKGVLLEHPGSSPVLLHVGDKVVALPAEFNVDATNGLVAELKTLLGPAAILGS